MKYVIIGNSAAAIGAVHGIRQIDTLSEITIVSSERYHTYGRPLISYYLQGKTDLEKMKYRPDDFYEKNNCKLMLSTTVTRIDPDGKTVMTDKGNTIAYDKLLVATGSTPFIPSTPGYDDVAEKYTFMSLDDALALELAATDKRVLIVGAGLIGLKCAEGLSSRAKSVAVTDLADRVLSSILDNDCAALVQNKLEQNSIELYLGDCVEQYSNNNARMKSGRTIEFDVLVTAIGVRPNIGLLRDARAEINRGIVTDTSMKTSLDDIYAAGDCTESLDITSGDKRVLALLPNAFMQGECAGRNMAGEFTEFDKAIPMNAIGFFGLHIASAGTYTGQMYEQRTPDGIKRLYYGDYLNGFIMVGNISRAGIYTNIVRNRIPLSELDAETLKKSPLISAFSREYRTKTLGGVV